jgi:hypothetical protein
MTPALELGLTYALDVVAKTADSLPKGVVDEKWWKLQIPHWKGALKLRRIGGFAHDDSSSKLGGHCFVLRIDI